MTQFQNRITIWSSLHEPGLIYGSSQGSVYESAVYRVHSEPECGSDPGLLLSVQIARTSLHHYSMQQNTHNPLVPTHARTHADTKAYVVHTYFIY